MSARLWRHQGLLALIAGVLLVVASLLVGWAGDVETGDDGAVRRLTWAMAAAGAATATVLLFALVHVTRVFSLTFKGEGE